jgi:hypothetical protein
MRDEQVGVDAEIEVEWGDHRGQYPSKSRFVAAALALVHWISFWFVQIVLFGARHLADLSFVAVITELVGRLPAAR